MNRKSKCGAGSMALVVAVLAIACAAAASAAPVYRAVDVGLLDSAHETTLRDLDDRAEAIGTSGRFSVSWTPAQGLAILPSIPGAEGGLVLWALGSRREAAGATYAFDGASPEAVVVAPGEEPRYILRGTWAEAGFGQGASWPPIHDMSNSGEVLGTSNGTPWLWSEAAGLRTLGDADGSYDAGRVNDHAQVVGSRVVDVPSRDCYGSRAFVYDDATRRFVALDGGPPDIRVDVCARDSAATALNDRGQVVGYRDELQPSGASGYSIFLWSREAGFQRLPYPHPAWRDGVPVDINDRGQVVGTLIDDTRSPFRAPRRFFYWDADTGMVDVQALLDPSDPATAAITLHTAEYAIRINARGVISLPGRIAGDTRQHWFMLFPQ